MEILRCTRNWISNREVTGKTDILYWRVESQQQPLTGKCNMRTLISSLWKSIIGPSIISKSEPSIFGILFNFHKSFQRAFRCTLI